MQIVSPPPPRVFLSAFLFAGAVTIFSSACVGEADCHEGQVRCNPDGTIGTCNTYANCGDSGFFCDTVWESEACAAPWSCQTSTDLSGDSAPTCLPASLKSECAATSVESSLLDPIGVALADINADGQLDIIAVGASTSAFFGHGDGSFDSGPVTASGWNAASLTTADFNGDGHVDILGLAMRNGALELEESDGDGAGNFGPPFSRAGSPAIESFYGPPLAGDVNEDGKADVVQDSVLLVSGKTAASIAWPDACDPSGDPAQISARGLVDLDGDKHLDLVALGDLGACVVYGDGKGGFANGALAASGAFGGSTLLVADFDGDGQVDLAIAPPSAAAGITMLFNHGTRSSFGAVSLASSQTMPFVGALTADVDGDGRADWVAGGTAFLTVWLSQANGQPGEPVYYALKATQPDFTIFALARLHGGTEVDAVIASGNLSVVATVCN